MLILFVFLVLFVLYTYFGYYLCLRLALLVAGVRQINADVNYIPDISIIVAARNECTNIGKRIRNLLESDYPKDKMQIIVVSDASQDSTVAEVNKIKNETDVEIICIELSTHSGKPTALNAAVKRARAEYLVFADARQTFEPVALRELVRNFHDERVGCVSGQLVFEDSTKSSIKKEVNAYWDYEKKIRMLESDTGSVVGATGAIYALRKKLYQALPAETILDDVLVPMNAAMQGYRVIFEKRAIAYDVVAKDFEKEKARKIRTLAGNWQLLILRPSLLNPFSNPLFFRFLSHKLFRVMVPYAIIMMIIMVLLAGNDLAILLMLMGSILLALLLIFERYLPGKIIVKMVGLARAFLYLNYFALLAPYKLFTAGNIWQK